MKSVPNLRRLLTGFLAILLLAASAARLPAQKTLPLKPDVPGTATNHRLILKDGTYQLVRKYEVVGTSPSSAAASGKNSPTIWWTGMPRASGNATTPSRQKMRPTR